MPFLYTKPDKLVTYRQSDSVGALIRNVGVEPYQLVYLELLSGASATPFLSRAGLFRIESTNKVATNIHSNIKLDYSPIGNGSCTQHADVSSSALYLRAYAQAWGGTPAEGNWYAAVTVRINRPVGLPTFDQLWVYSNYSVTQSGGGNKSSIFAYQGVTPGSPSDIQVLETDVPSGITLYKLDRVPLGGGSFYLWVSAQARYTGVGPPGVQCTTSVYISKVEWRNAGALVATMDFTQNKVIPAMGYVQENSVNNYACV